MTEDDKTPPSFHARKALETLKAAVRPVSQGVGAWGDLAGYPEYRKAEVEEEKSKA